jgi:gas vesicle protein
MSNGGHSDLGLAFAFLAGGLFGAGLALLLAPKPGTETRAQVADWMKLAQEKAREMAAKHGEASEVSDEGGSGPMPVPGSTDA